MVLSLSKLLREFGLNAKGVNKTYVEELISDIRKSIEDIINYTVKPYRATSEAERYAARYCLIVMVEALMALSLHIVRRVFNVESETPFHAFRTLKDKDLISTEECDELLKLIRLRNLLVHRYWVVDDEKIYRNVKGDFRSVLNLIERIQKVVRQ